MQFKCKNSSILNNSVKWLNNSVWAIDGILTGTTMRSLGGPGTNDNGGVVHIPENSKTETSPGDAVLCHLQDTRSVLLSCKDAVGVLYSPWTGHIWKPWLVLVWMWRIHRAKSRDSESQRLWSLAHVPDAFEYYIPLIKRDFECEYSPFDASCQSSFLWKAKNSTTSWNIDRPQSQWDNQHR